MRTRLLALSIVLLAARQVAAHHEGLSSLIVSIEDRGLRAVMVVAVDDLALWHPPAPGQTPAEYAASAAAQLAKAGPDLIELRANYNVLRAESARTAVEDDRLVRLEQEYALDEPSAVTALQVYSHLLPRLPRDHRQMLYVDDLRGAGTGGKGETVAGFELSPGRFSAFVDVPAVASRAPGTRPATAPSVSPAVAPPPPSFFLLGVEHILTGYDHLLFLAALLLVCTTFREAAAVITCFTLAHSVTLALAALDVVRLPGSVVEPVIAASIVYVGLENLFRYRRERHRLGWRVAVTFAFGLVHGLGFASVLRDAGLGRAAGGVVVPLLLFNAGVECGQLAVAAVVFPLLLALRRRRDTGLVWVPVTSCVIAFAGAWWLFERVLD